MDLVRAEIMKNAIVSTIDNRLPNKEFLTIDDLVDTGLFGNVSKMNLAILRRSKRGPKYEKSGKFIAYRKKDFIEWVLHKTKIHLTENKTYKKASNENANSKVHTRSKP